jgi:hypothetical protein
MAKWTIGFGVVLAIVSLSFWVGMGKTEMAALHPAGLGLGLILCGAGRLSDHGHPRRDTDREGHDGGRQSAGV